MPTRTAIERATAQVSPTGVRGVASAAELSPIPPSSAAPIDLPFLPPPDTVLDVPVPPSVNRTRGFSGQGLGRIRAWYRRADMALIANGQYRAAQKNISRFELVIVLDEKQCRMDLDNVAKAGIDFLRRIQIVKDDGPKHMRKVTIEWGVAPAGCRIIVKPIEGEG